MARVGFGKSFVAAAAASLVTAAVAAPGASATPTTTAITSVAVASPVAAWGPVSTLGAGSRGGRVSVSADGTRATVLYTEFNDIGDAGEYWLTRSASVSHGVLAWGPVQWASPQGSQRGYQMALSKDGSRALYVWEYYGCCGAPVVIKVMARTVTGNVGVEGPVQTLTAGTPGTNDVGASVATSDDGSRAVVAWEHRDGASSTTQMSLATVAGGTPSWGTVADLGMPAGTNVVPDSVSMTGDGSQVTIGWSDLSSRTGTVYDSGRGLRVHWGPVTRPPQATTDPEGFAVSRDGTRLLAVWNSGTSAAPRVAAAAAALVDDVATWGPTAALPQLNARVSDAFPAQLPLSHDGTTALVPVVSTDEQGLNPVTSVDLLSLGTDASITVGTHIALYRAADTPSLSLSADGRVGLAAWGRYLWTAGINGTTAVWHRPSQPITDGPQPNVALSADGSHAVAIWTASTGDYPPTVLKARAGFPDTTAPVARMTAPTAAFTTSARIALAWTASDGGSGVKTSAVRWTRTPANGGTTTPWNAPIVWSALTTRSLTANAALGYRYCFQARSTDWSGNTSAWSASRCTRTPFDDRSLSASATWRRGLDPAWIARTYSYTTAYGARLSTTRAMSVRQVGVIATTCRTCGTLALYVGRTKVGTLSLRSTTTHARVLLLLPRLSTSHYGLVRLVVTSCGKPVKIDAVAISNT